MRSYWFADGITAKPVDDTYELISVRGRIALRLTKTHPYRDFEPVDEIEWKLLRAGPPELRRPDRYWYPMPPVRQWEFAGFEYLNGHYASDIDHAFTQFECRDWLLALALSIPPLIWVRRRRR